MANGGTLFAPLGHGLLDAPPRESKVKVKYGLHSAAKGMEKNALAILVVAYHLATLDFS